jgi:hypothetical protein
MYFQAKYQPSSPVSEPLLPSASPYNPLCRNPIHAVLEVGTQVITVLKKKERVENSKSKKCQQRNLMNYTVPYFGQLHHLTWQSKERPENFSQINAHSSAYWKNYFKVSGLHFSIGPTIGSIQLE